MTESAGKGITYFLAKNWWLTMIRGLAALGLGLGLFAWPESTLDSLLRFMALYWLSSGLMSLMRAVRGDRRGRGFFFMTGKEVSQCRDHAEQPDVPDDGQRGERPEDADAVCGR